MNVKNDWGEPSGEVIIPPRRGQKRPARSRKRPWLLPALAVAGGLGTVVGGYFAVSAAADRDAMTSTLTQHQERAQGLTDALELHRASKVELDTQLTTCREDLDSEKTQAAGTGAELAACQRDVDDLAVHKREAKAASAEFTRLTSRFRKMIDSGRLEISFRRGEMVVKLPSRVLFASGSATLSKDGEQALAEVASVLRTMKKRRFTVAGHTDRVPVRNSEFASNWELSTARAVTVTRTLIRRGVKPRNLAAAGYGEFAPISNNKTAAGRKRNQRIEIILEPDLSKLPISKLAKKSAKPKPRPKKRSKRKRR